METLKFYLLESKEKVVSESSDRSQACEDNQADQGVRSQSFLFLGLSPKPFSLIVLYPISDPQGTVYGCAQE